MGVTSVNNSTDLIKLYSEKILALAADIPLTKKLAQPEGTAKVRSPLCGSTVTVDIIVNNGLITGFRQNVKACALGQAAASVVGKNIIGRSRQDIVQVKDELECMLTKSGPPPSSPFDEMKVLEPAKDYKNRHASIMLALEATLNAFDNAEKAKLSA